MEDRVSFLYEYVIKSAETLKKECDSGSDACAELLRLKQALNAEKWLEEERY